MAAIGSAVVASGTSQQRTDFRECMAGYLNTLDQIPQFQQGRNADADSLRRMLSTVLSGTVTDRDKLTLGGLPTQVSRHSYPPCSSDASDASYSSYSADSSDSLASQRHSACRLAETGSYLRPRSMVFLPSQWTERCTADHEEAPEPPLRRLKMTEELKAHEAHEAHEAH